MDLETTYPAIYNFGMHGIFSIICEQPLFCMQTHIFMYREAYFHHLNNMETLFWKVYL